MLVHTTTTSNNVTVTAAAGVKRDSNQSYVVVGRKIESEAITTYDDMINNIAQTITAMRGQYNIFETTYEDNAWKRWLEAGVRLAWAPGQRYALYQINSVNGVPSFMDACNDEIFDITYADPNNNKLDEMYKYIENINNYNEHDVPPPYQAFAQYGTTLFSDLDFLKNCTVGIDIPVVSTEHMKISDSKELQWLNVAMHMVTKKVASQITDQTKTNALCGALFNSAPSTSATTIATQAVAPYPVQWKETNTALAQALEIAAAKLLGAQKMEHYMGHKGDAMNIIMGAAFFCIKPHKNQVHLKTMYSQSDKIMPDDTRTYIRDISNSHVKFIQALQDLNISVVNTS